MKGYSHSDRLGGKNELLDPQRIQKIICEGTDIFGMLPEAYNVSSMQVRSLLDTRLIQAFSMGI